ncbi:MAG TPA: hypothetical protein VLA17_14825 [Candidatus Limnocylindria bacterium]|nr:hypothetical protein [Candidatus Limnocylindria bacterium]
MILLLFAGLVAFSSAMKELNQVQQLTLQTSGLIAHWADAFAPVEHYAILAPVETCEQTKIRVPPLPPLPRPAVAPVKPPAPESGAPALVPPTPPKAAPVVPPAKPRRVVRPSHDEVEVRVLLSTDDLVEKSLRDALEADVTLKALKAKNRRHQIFITPDGKDVLLKSLNRGINLRSAS